MARDNYGDPAQFSGDTRSDRRVWDCDDNHSARLLLATHSNHLKARAFNCLKKQSSDISVMELSYLCATP